jgi:hypothetical protein
MQAVYYTNLICECDRSDPPQSPLISYLVHTSLGWSVECCRSPLPPLNKGANELEVPLLRGIKGDRARSCGCSGDLCTQ